ncbi:MAG: hypothetical protein AAF494_09560 [Pseudomonadota bacterium]
MIATLIKYPPWEHGWTNPIIGLGFGFAIILFSGFFQRLEERLDVGEARFDSETGKQLPPYKNGK